MQETLLTEYIKLKDCSCIGDWHLGPNNGFVDRQTCHSYYEGCMSTLSFKAKGLED